MYKSFCCRPILYHATFWSLSIYVRITWSSEWKCLFLSLSKRSQNKKQWQQKCGLKQKLRKETIWISSHLFRVKTSETAYGTRSMTKHDLRNHAFNSPRRKDVMTVRLTSTKNETTRRDYSPTECYNAPLTSPSTNISPHSFARNVSVALL